MEQTIRLPRRLKTPEAAAHCGVSESFLTKARMTGAGPQFIKIGAAVIYDVSDLDHWLEQRKRLSTSAAA